MIASVDPGKHACAYAIGEDRRIIDVGYGTDPDIWADIRLHTIYLELPQVYPGAQKTDPNDLIQVAYQGGRFVEKFRRAQRVLTLAPREWKGTVKKEIMLRRIEKCLDANEIALVNILKLPKETRHNALDACGILLHAFGRLEY